MAITSIGYEGTIMPGGSWAKTQFGLGAKYFVQYSGAAKVTSVPGGTRQVSISPGNFGGWGIVDDSSSAVTLTLPTVASGTKWFLIVARRTWGTTNATTFAYIDAGTNGATLPTRNVEPGVLDDQPLAMVPLTAGQTVPGTPVDVRVVQEHRGGFMQAWSEIALQYIDFLGSEVRIGNDIWSCYYTTPSSGRSWHKNPGQYGGVTLPVFTGSDVLVSPSGWAGQTTRAFRDGNRIHIDLELRRTSSNIPFSSNGAISDIIITTLKPAWRPTFTSTFQMLYHAESGATYGGDIWIHPSGNVYILSGTPNTSIGRRPEGNRSLLSTIEFTTEKAS